MKAFRFIIILIFLGVFFDVFAQSITGNNITYVKETELLFSQGVNKYRLRKFQQAKDIFLRLKDSYPPHQRITTVYLMLAKTYYKLGEYEETFSTLRTLLANYPQSNYVDDAHYAMGNCYYKMKKYAQSVREFLWVVDYSKDQKLVEKTRKLVYKVIDYNLTLKEITNLKTEITGMSSGAILNIQLAQKLMNVGDKEKAISLLIEYRDTHPRNKYLSQVNKVLKTIQDQQKIIELKIGVILPLSSEFSDQAQAVLAGIKYAQQNINKNSQSLKIKLIVKDSEGSIINCIKSAQELVKDEKIIAIIGELESEKTASIASIIDLNGVPLVTPVASENGLAALSRYIFQANGDLEKRGALLAEFAIKELGHRTFATLAPADNYGKEMTDSFTAMVDKLNGEIVAQKWFYGNTQDMGRQFSSIRELGYNRMNKDSIYYEYVKNLTPSQRAKFKKETIPVTTIDAIFFPIYTEDIKYVVPQYAFANIRAQILGGQYWYEINELSNRNVISHVDSLIFESDYFFDDIKPEFHNFRTNFRKVMGRTPKEMECYGYDAMLLIGDAITHKAINREAVRDYLDNIDYFKGIRGPITFKTNERVNSEQRIISFINGRFVLIK